MEVAARGAKERVRAIEAELHLTSSPTTFSNIGSYDLGSLQPSCPALTPPCRGPMAPSSTVVSPISTVSVLCTPN